MLAITNIHIYMHAMRFNSFRFLLLFHSGCKILNRWKKTWHCSVVVVVIHLCLFRCVYSGFICSYAYALYVQYRLTFELCVKSIAINVMYMCVFNVIFFHFQFQTNRRLESRRWVGDDVSLKDLAEILFAIYFVEQSAKQT